MIALYVHPKNSNHLRSHLRAIMALDHSRFKAWKTKQAEVFAIDKFTYKILPTNLGVCKPICLYFLCIISEEKQYYLSYRPRKKCSISQFSETNCSQSVFRKSWAFSESVQKMSKMTYTASRFSHLTSAKFAVNINRVTLQHNKKFITFINFFFI